MVASVWDGQSDARVDEAEVFVQEFEVRASRAVTPILARIVACSLAERFIWPDRTGPLECNLNAETGTACREHTISE
jgi:hypothetical protein